MPHQATDTDTIGTVSHTRTHETTSNPVRLTGQANRLKPLILLALDTLICTSRAPALARTHARPLGAP